MMSIFSPDSSLITLRTRWPIGPMQAPLALRPGTLVVDRDLGPVARLAGHGDDLDGAVGDLGHLEREQLADEVRMGARQRDQRFTRAARDADDVAAQPVAVFVASRPGTCSAAGMTPSEPLASLPTRTTTSPRALALASRWMTPATMSPSRAENSP